MPTVPQYHREVAPQLTPTPYIRANVNQDMFGGNIAQAGQNLGRAMDNFGNAMLEIKNRFDDTMILGLVNNGAKWEEENLYNKENGYYYKFGKDAYGQSEAILKDYDDFMAEQLKMFKGAAATRAKETYTKMRERVVQGVTAHDFKQGIAWSNTEAETGKANYLNNAVNMRNNPDEISKSLMSGYQIIEWQGELQHKDAATINFEKMNYRSSLHEAVLNAYLGEGSLKAAQYLEKHKGEIRPEKLPQYVSAVKQTELTYTARSIAAQYVGRPLEEVYGSINSIKDPQTREAVMREYSVLNNQMEAVQREKNNKFMDELSNQLADAIVNGTDPNELKKNILSSNLPYDVKKKQIDYINDCLALNQEVSLWNETEYIENLKSTDHEAFQKLDLSQFALTKAERQKYLEEQKKVVEYSTQDQLRDMVKEFDTFFWAGKNSLDSGVYKDELIGMLARIERLQGKAFDIKNIDEGQLATLIKGFGYKADAMPSELSTFGIKDFKNIDETKELYMRAKAVADVQDRVARTYVSFRNQNGREPEPNEMYGIVQKVYMDVARENHTKTKAVVDRKMQVNQGIKNTTVKKSGYTKALTYFEENVIPDIERDTGVAMKITSSYRNAAKNKSVGGSDGSLHTKGMAIDIFPANPTKENIEKTTEYLLIHPAVKSIFCNNPYVSRYKGNNKLLFDKAVAYEKKTGVTHTNHFHITLNDEFGGTEQIREAYMTAAKPSQISAIR